MYPEAKMIEVMKIWKLPSDKEGMLSELCESGDLIIVTQENEGDYYGF